MLKSPGSPQIMSVKLWQIFMIHGHNLWRYQTLVSDYAPWAQTHNLVSFEITYLEQWSSVGLPLRSYPPVNVFHVCLGLPALFAHWLGKPSLILSVGFLYRLTWPSWFCCCFSDLISWCFQWQEELCSDSVERIVVNPNAAYDKFKDKHVSTKGLGQWKSNQITYLYMLCI